MDTQDSLDSDIYTDFITYQLNYEEHFAIDIYCFQKSVLVLSASNEE